MFLAIFLDKTFRTRLLLRGENGRTPWRLHVDIASYLLIGQKTKLAADLNQKAKNSITEMEKLIINNGLTLRGGSVLLNGSTSAGGKGFPSVNTTSTFG